MRSNAYGAQNASKLGSATIPSRGSRKAHKPGVPNKLEAEYEIVLRARQAIGEIAWYKFESVRFRLADRCHYLPDFFVVRADGALEAHECKGYMEDDAAVKLRVFREVYPEIRLMIVRKGPQGWKVEERK